MSTPKTTFTRYNRLTTVLNEQHCSFNQLSNRVVQPVWQPAVYTIQPFVKPAVKLTTGLTTGCIMYTNIYPVVKPVWQQVVSCKRGLITNRMISLPVSMDCEASGSTSSTGNGINKLEMSLSAKSGNIAIKSCSFCSRIIHEKLPVGRRMWNSAHWVHQQLQICGLNTERSAGFAFKPDR